MVVAATGFHYQCQNTVGGLPRPEFDLGRFNAGVPMNLEHDSDARRLVQLARDVGVDAVNRMLQRFVDARHGLWIHEGAVPGKDPGSLDLTFNSDTGGWAAIRSTDEIWRCGIGSFEARLDSPRRLEVTTVSTEKNPGSPCYLHVTETIKW